MLVFIFWLYGVFIEVGFVFVTICLWQVLCFHGMYVVGFVGCSFLIHG
jgi:hypothetical protein